MSKYIIDTETWANLFEVQRVGVYGIGNDIVTDEKTVWSRMFRLDELEELNSDYINEHYGSLQDEAYERGYEDGKNIIDKGCEGCKYTVRFADDEPCKSCSNCYKNKYEPTPKQDDRIEVGDEVIWKNGSIALIVTLTYETDDFRWCDGVSKDGKAYHVLLENVSKTGKHYDIQSILEAMRK